MEWVVAALTAMLALTLVLAVPVRLVAGLADDGRPRWRVELDWLGGLARVGRDEGGFYWALGPVRRTWAPLARKKEGSPPVRSGGASLTRWGRLALCERRAVGRLAGEVWAATDIAARGDISYGCQDPALTAWLHAFYCAARAGGRLADLAARPDFTAAVWRGRAEAVVAVRPVRLALPAARFFIRMLTARIADKRTGGRRVWQTQV